MTFVRNLAVNYIEQRLDERNDFTNWIFDHLRKETEPNTRKHSKKNAQPSNDDAFLHRVLDCLEKCSKEFSQSYSGEIHDVTEEIKKEIYALGDDKENFYLEYQEVANRLFSDPVGWIQIFVFLEFNAQLVNKIIDPTSTKRSDKVRTSKMVSTLISYLCKYFNDRLRSWHLEKPESWIGFLVHEDDVHQRQPRPKIPLTMPKATTLGLAAFAAIIGGFYICSKLAVQ